MNIFKKYIKYNGELLIVMLVVGTVVELLYEPVLKLDPNNWLQVTYGAVLPILVIVIAYDIIRKRYRKRKKGHEQ